MKDKFTEAELKAAYETCLLMKSHCDNVLASVGFENSKSDKEWSKQATKFVKAYERVQASKIAKSGKGGYLGDALQKLGQIQETIKDIAKTAKS